MANSLDSRHQNPITTDSGKHTSRSAFVQNVLSTPELMVSIFLELDLRTLTTSVPLVCKHWRSITVDVAAVRQALFLESTSNGSGPSCLNPLLLEKFPAFLGEGEEGRVTRQSFSRISLANEQMKECFMYEGASWRRMLVSQPPICELAVLDIRGTQSRSRPTETLDRIKKMSFPSGVRMGVLYDLAVDWMSGIWLVTGFQVLSSQLDADRWAERYSDGQNLTASHRRKVLRLVASSSAVFIRHEGASCFLGIPRELAPQILKDRKAFLTRYLFARTINTETDYFPSSSSDEGEEISESSDEDTNTAQGWNDATG